ncbi:MAC/perforin domain-containing protein [Mucilaginibacter sp. cycad4]|uniref:MAC/perforin domain-containing protein n=1 Tax=Mucilaginibacter sp. cycad4 TaxID=3342096 RepID=UPI002AAA924E|nr:MAC/perforin domain-containing protein [Mucilaginibacter gossypii]WPV00564.1 MAC/perforin domain-containing protein [Mucilaginibacter gossypii]
MIKNLNLKVLLAGMFITSASMLTSCKKELALVPETNEKPSKLATRDAGVGPYDLLGFGYDVTGEYASSNSTTYQVVDIAKIALAEPNRFVTDLNVTQYFESHSGSTAEDYSQNLSYSTGASLTVGAFSGTINEKFREFGSLSSKYSYADASMLIRQKRLKFDAPLSLIKSSYLTPVFKSDVNSMTAQQLVTKYGTHVLTDIILGAKLSLYYRSQTTIKDRALSAKAGAEAKGLFGIFGASTSIAYQDSLINSNFDQTLRYETVGGDGSKGLLLGDMKPLESTPAVNIGNWQSSCTRENAAFIQLGNSSTNLILLSDLIDDPTKSTAVKNYINQYLANKHVHLSNTLATVKSSTFYNIFLRLNGENFVSNTDGSGVVNCQYTASAFEKVLFAKQADGTYTIESNRFPGLFLRMDGRNVPNNNDGGGVVNLQNGASDYEKFKIIKQSNGTYVIQSAKFGTYLRMDARGFTSSNNSGGGIVNCKSGSTVPGGWETFVITPDLY